MYIKSETNNLENKVKIHIQQQYIQYNFTINISSRKSRVDEDFIPYVVEIRIMLLIDSQFK